MTGETTFIEALLIALGVGAASGAIGSFIILRRMALVGDALSHVALPGIALALAYQIDPFWGVLVFLLGAAFLIWWLEGRTNLPSEAIVGLLFTASLAIGVLTIPDTEILESLFGEFPKFSPLVLGFVLTLAFALTAAIFILTRRFTFSIVAPELARIELGGRYIDFYLLLVFVMTVALGIKLVGTLLMGALTIIPAAIAKNVTRSMSGYTILSTFLGGSIAVAGTIAAKYFQFPHPGAVIILIGAGIFLVSLPFKKI